MQLIAKFLLWLGLVITALLIVILCYAFIYLPIWDKYNRTYGFDQQAWLSGQHEQDAVRAGMLRDLMAHHLYQGMSRGDVLTLLGPAEERIIWQLPTTITIPDSINPALQNHTLPDSVRNAQFSSFRSAHLQLDTFMIYKAGTSMWSYRFLVIKLNGKQRVEWKKEEYHENRSLPSDNYNLF